MRAHTEVYRLNIQCIILSELEIGYARCQGAQEIRDLEGPLHVEVAKADAERRGVRNVVEMLSYIRHPVGRRVKSAPLSVPVEIPQERVEERDRGVAREARRGKPRDVRLKLEEEPQALAKLQCIRRRGSREARGEQPRRVRLAKMERRAAR
jgi:hypothetical protein